MIDQQTKERILEAANIVDVVSEFVTLKRAGANYKGLCPFHSDRTPSFSVSPARNYCHCFSCGKGGSPVGFIMEHEQMSYPEALRWLANKYHIEIKEKELSEEEKQQQTERESMFIVNEWTARYYADILHNNPSGRSVGMQYFRSRGIRDDIIEKFRLGFALDDRNAMPREAISKGYKAQYMLKTGNCYAKDSGRPVTGAGDIVDRFYGRAIFPWIGLSGKVIAFGGRKLDKETKGVQQKYVNSPDSDIYHKDHELYGIYQAKKAIVQQDCVYMVEGYTDVISMHQCGIENVVANSGTALSKFQINMLRRLTKNIVFLYDGDAAGLKAALRGLDMVLEEGMNIKMMFLPDGDDPDSFAKKHTAEEFREYIESHQMDFVQFKINTLVKGITDPVKRSEGIRSIIGSIALIPDPIIRQAFLQDCATKLSMPEQTLLTQMNKFIIDRKKETKPHDGTIAAGTQGRTSTTPQSASPAAQSASAAPEGMQGTLPDDLPDDFIPDEAFSQPSQQQSPSPTPTVQISPYEKLIIECVLNYGEEVLYDDIETEDGSTIALTVAQFIYHNLTSDNITLQHPIYQRILIEAVNKSGTEGFHAAPYFSQHPDFEVSKTAVALLVERDKYVLSKSLVKQETRATLQQHVEHILLDLRKNILDTRLQELLRQIAQVTDDHEKAAAMMVEYQQLLNDSRSISRRLGKSLR